MKHAFVLSYGSYDFRWSFIVMLDQDGQQGLGEATAILYYGWTVEQIELELNKIDQLLRESASVEMILSDVSLSPPTRSALQCAYVDLQAKLQGITLTQFYNIKDSSLAPLSSVTITGTTFEDLKKQIEQYDWPIYKIKMGSPDDDIRFNLIEAFPNKLFRIDANAGWKMDWVLANKKKLKYENIECIEQPFPVDAHEQNQKIHQLIQKPIIADESCLTIDDIHHCTQFFTGVNIKIMKCGGWDKSLEIIKACRAHNLIVMLGCMTETSIGISHAANMAGLVDYLDIDGAVLIANDIADGCVVHEGKIKMSPHAGCGAILNMTS